MSRKKRSNLKITKTMERELVHHEIRNRNNSKRFRELEINWYSHLVSQAFNKGKKVYLVTLMYRNIPRKLPSRLERMLSEAKWIETTLLHRVVRCPKSKKGKKKRPKIFGAPDCGPIKGVPELDRYLLINDGWHFHMVVILPRKSRLKDDLAEHFRLNESVYLKPDKYLLRIHVERVTTRPRRVARYAFKRGARENLRDYYLN